MRKLNSLINIKYNILFFVVNSILAFVARTVSLKYFGADYTGLSDVLRNVVGIMNVAELGISAAITYSLYKPIREKNHDKINELLLLFKYIYRYIGIFIGCISIVISLFLGEFIHSDITTFNEVRMYFFIYVGVSISSYFISYLQILAIADQKKYIITKITGTISIIRVFIQIMFAMLFNIFLFWVLTEAFFNILTYILINKRIRKDYKWLSKNNRNSKISVLLNNNKSIITDTKNLFFHKIGGIIIFQTDSVVISANTNLMSVTIYSNYLMITGVFTNLAGQLFGGLKASIGDLVAEGNDEKTYNMWRDISYFSNFLATIVVYCLYININNLITIWLGNEYTFSNLVVIALLTNVFIQITRNPIDSFKEGYGIFWDKWSPFIEAIINLFVSIYLVNKIGIAGVFIGTLISNIIIILIWKPYVLFKYGFKIPIHKYITTWSKLILFSGASIFLSNLFFGMIAFNGSNLLLTFVTKCVVSLIFIVTIYVGISLLDLKHIQFYNRYFLSILRKNNY